MLTTAIIFFSIAIVLGIYLLTYILKNKRTPKAIVFTHGPLAVIALILLIIYAFFNSHHFPLISIILFALAAMGGFMMILRDLSGKSVPKWMALGHGITAVIGFILLIIFTFT